MSDFDTHTNLLQGTVKTPPSPSTTGETFGLMPGDGARFTPNQPVTLVPLGKDATHDNSEIGYLRAVSGDILTITRGQEGTTPMQVRFGWKVIASVTAKTLTDIENAVASKVDVVAGKGLSTNDYTSADKTKLGGIAPGATQNASDSALRDRTTHTGTQAMSTVTGLPAALDGKVAKSDLVYNIKDYGAVGNETTNDTAAVQAAITAAEAVGGTVFIPAGTYKVVLPQVTVGGITIMGSGWKSVLRLADSTLTPNGQTIGLWINGATDVIVKNLAIDGNFSSIARSGTYATSSPLWTPITAKYGAQSPKNYQYGSGVDMDTYLQYSACLRITNAQNVLVEGCYVYNSKSSGILVDGDTVDRTQEVMIRNNRVRLTWDNGIYFHRGVRYGSAIGNHCSDTQYAGITAIYVNDITVSDNVVHDCGPSNSDSAGIEYCGVNTGLIAGNTIKNALFEGILLKNTDETNLVNGASSQFVRNYDISITGNRVTDVHDPRFPSSTAYGINVRSADRTFILGNSVRRADYGISVGDVATSTTIMNNTVDKSYGWGMMLGNSPDVVDTKVIGNIIENGAANGVVAYAPIVFRGNIVRNNDQQGIDLAPPPPGLPFKTDYIEGNTFADNGYNGVGAGAGSGNFAIIRDNEFLNSDNRVYSDGSSTAASTTFSSATASFTAADVGSKIIIPSAGSSNGNDTLVTTISSRTSATTVVLADAAQITRTDLAFTVYRPINVYYDGVMTSGNTALTSVTAGFTASDVGKTVILYASDKPEPSVLGTFTVASYTSPTVVQLNASPANDTNIMFVIRRNYGRQARAVYISNDSDIFYQRNRSLAMSTENYNAAAVSRNSVIRDNYDFGSNASNNDPLISPLYPTSSVNYNRWLGAKDVIEFIDASGGAKDVWLPDVANIRPGKPFTIVKRDSTANAVTVRADQNINGSPTYALTTQYGSITVVSNGSTYIATSLQDRIVTTDGAQTINDKTLGGLTITDATNVVLGTTSGTKIGTATTQKLGFFNATPAVQPIATTEIGTVLSSLGLRAVGTAYPITTSGAANLTGNVTTGALYVGASVRFITGSVTSTETVNTSSASKRFYNATSGNITVTLPATTTAGYEFTFKKLDSSANTVTLSGTIDGATNYVLASQYKYVTLISTTTSGTWYVIGNN